MLNAARWLVAGTVPKVAQVASGQSSLFDDETSQTEWLMIATCESKK
jgi:hypothetical protein